MIVNKADVIFEQSLLGKLSPALGAKANEVLILFVIAQVTQEFIVKWKQLATDEAAMCLQFLVVGSCVLDHELHRINRRGTMHAIHFPRVHNIFVRCHVFVK